MYKAFASLEQAILARRMSKDDMILGIKSFNRGTKKLVEDGDYFEATSEFEQAIKYFDKTNRDEGSQINVQIPCRGPVDRSRGDRYP